MRALFGRCFGATGQRGVVGPRAVAVGGSTGSMRPGHGSLSLLAWNGAEWAAWTGEATGEAHMNELRAATWNVWFDRKISTQGGGAEERRAALHDLLFDRSTQQLDLVMLQELTAASWAALLANERVRADWLVTDLPETLVRSGTWYGVALMCRRTWALAAGARAFSVALPTRLGRSLVALELGSPEHPLVRAQACCIANVQVRVATLHAESMEKDQDLRSQQFAIARDTLEQSPAPQCALLGGDTNIEAYDELKPLLDRGFVDAFLATRPGASATDDALATFNTTYAEAAQGARHRKRLDYILSVGARPIESRLLGDEPYIVPSTGQPRPHPLGRDGLAFPSDHLGVEVAFALPSTPRAS